MTLMEQIAFLAERVSNLRLDKVSPELLDKYLDVLGSLVAYQKSLARQACSL